MLTVFFFNGQEVRYRGTVRVSLSHVSTACVFGNCLIVCCCSQVVAAAPVVEKSVSEGVILF